MKELSSNAKVASHTSFFMGLIEDGAQRISVVGLDQPIASFGGFRALRLSVKHVDEHICLRTCN